MKSCSNKNTNNYTTILTKINEITTLKVNDILIKEHKISIIGKGNKENYFPLPNLISYIYNVKFFRCN